MKSYARTQKPPALYQADGSVMLEIIMFSKSLHISLNPHP